MYGRSVELKLYPLTGMSLGLTGAASDGKKHHFYKVQIDGQAFLWHQIRCIVTILFHVGQGLEKPSIVQSLLDTEMVKTKKPAYEMASDIPLVLSDCCIATCRGSIAETLSRQTLRGKRA